MKKVFLLFSVIALFAACKKDVDLTSQNTTQEYSGIKNIADFDMVMSKIRQDGSSLTRLSRTLKLSEDAVTEMRNSIQFDKQGRFRGFTNSRLMNQELSVSDREFLLNTLTQNQIVIFSKDNKMITTPRNPNGKIAYEHRDWAWWPTFGSECCRPYVNATCITYNSSIYCH